MVAKKVLILFSLTSIVNLATYEDFNEENPKKSIVEEDISINKNNWNTRKWGSIYFLFPHVSLANVILKFDKKVSFVGILSKDWQVALFFILSGVMEYKWMFHKYCGINVRLNLNNMELYEDKFSSFLSFEPSLEWNYGKKGEHFFSGSFSPLGVAVIQNENDGKFVEDHCKKMLTLSFILLKYEYDRRIYLNFGKIKTSWYCIFTCFDDLAKGIFFNSLSIEFGLNIIGVNDWRKSKNNINAKI